jgi:hypothetical protein
LHYTIFSIECDFKYHLPITIAQLALFIAYLQNKSFAARTISTYVSALDFIHKIKIQAELALVLAADMPMVLTDEIVEPVDEKSYLLKCFLYLQYV